MDKLKADETLDFHNRVIAEVALGEKCAISEKSAAYILTSPLGHVYTNACPKGLHCVKLYGDTNYDKINWDTKVDFIRASSFMPSNEHAKQLKRWLQMYFSNPIQCKDIEIAFCGLEDYGEFNSRVWMTIYKTCPPGEMMSYRELAERSGSGAGASKVVGYAINKNPYMLVVGDHRVIKATGEIWCENESQRNKLRRLLVKYEVGFTDKSFEDALLEVKERNEASKPARGKSGGGAGSGAGRARKSRAAVKREPEEEAAGGSKSARGVRKPARKGKAATKRAATKRAGRRLADDSDEEDTDDESFVDDEEEQQQR